MPPRPLAVGLTPLSPASIAMLATSLQEVSGGRFSLGLGDGSPPLATLTRPPNRPVEELDLILESLTPGAG